MLRARFRLLATTAALLIGCLPLATALSEYDTLAIVNEFAENFIAPNNLRVAQGINRWVWVQWYFAECEVGSGGHVGIVHGHPCGGRKAGGAGGARWFGMDSRTC